MAVITKEIEAERAATGSSLAATTTAAAAQGDVEMGTHTTVTAQDVK